MSRLSERIENFNKAFDLYEEVRNKFIKDNFKCLYYNVKKTKFV